MGRKRKNHSQEFKAKVALDAVKGVHTLSELASRHGVHATQIGQWKKQLLDHAKLCFEPGRSGGTVDVEEVTSPLYQEIGRLKVELDFLKKKFSSLT